METKKFNVNEYYIKDVAYELDSHPDYIFKKELLDLKPNKCNDYNSDFINLLYAPKILKNYLQFIENIKKEFQDIFFLNMNDIMNIFFYISETTKEEIPMIIMGLDDNFNEREYSFINIPLKIKQFKNSYQINYEKKKIFRELKPTLLDGPHISLKTFKISIKNDIQLNELFDKIKTSLNFPFISYHSYLKIHSEYDNDEIIFLSDNFKENTNTDKIIIYYLTNNQKYNDFTSYTPINIEYKNQTSFITISMEEFMWNNIKSTFFNLFDNITFGSEKIISQEGSFFLFNTNINYSILSYICLNMSNDYIIKNERSSIKGGYKLIYNLDNINVTIKNKNITGSTDEKKIKILTEQSENTKYIQIYFRSKNNKLTVGDISCIQKYIGQLLTMYNKFSSDIITIYKNIIDFDIEEDNSKKDVVKTRGVKKINNIISESIGNSNAKKLNWARKCPGGKRQRQPKVSISPPRLFDNNQFYNDIIKQDENGVYHMNWPKDSDYWFSCNENTNEKYPSPMKQDNYFTPCCFKELNTKNIRDYITSTTTQIKTQIKFDKNTIILNLGTSGIDIQEEQLDNEQLVSTIFKKEISKLKKKYKEITNIDKQSNLNVINYNKLECIMLSLELLSDTNIIIFDELGSLILPIRTNYIGNIYYDTVYENTRFFVRKTDKYIEIKPNNSSKEIVQSLIENTKSFNINNTNNSKFNLPDVSLLEYQFIDSFGKCRIIKLKNKNIYCQTFIPPLPIKQSDDFRIQFSDITDVQQTSNLVVIGQCIEDKRCVEVMCEFYNFKVYCKIDHIQPINDIKVYETRKIIYNNTNIFQTYSKMREDSNKLKNKIIKNPTISDDEILQLVPNLNINDDEHQLIVNKLKFFRQLYTSKKSILQTYIEPITNISSLKKYPDERIVNISYSIIPKKYSLNIINDYDTATLFKNPYFIYFQNDIHLVQDTTSIQTSCYIHKYWNMFNINYKLDNKKSKCDSYIIFDTEGDEVLKLGNEINKIIVINPNQTNQKYMTLLTL
jgi:hypothetical protein